MEVMRGQSTHMEVSLEGLATSVMGGLQDELFNLTLDNLQVTLVLAPVLMSAMHFFGVSNTALSQHAGSSNQICACSLLVAKAVQQDCSYRTCISSQTHHTLSLQVPASTAGQALLVVIHLYAFTLTKPPGYSGCC